MQGAKSERHRSAETTVAPATVSQGPLFYVSCAWWSPFSSKAWVFKCFFSFWKAVFWWQWDLDFSAPVALGLHSHHSAGPSTQGLYPASLYLEVVQGPCSPGATRTLGSYCPAPTPKHSFNCDCLALFTCLLVIPEMSEGLNSCWGKGQRESGMGAVMFSNWKCHFVTEISMSYLPLGIRKPLLVFGHSARMVLSSCTVKKAQNKKIVLKCFRQSPLSCAQQLLSLSAEVKKHVPFESI